MMMMMIMMIMMMMQTTVLIMIMLKSLLFEIKIKDYLRILIWLNWMGLRHHTRNIEKHISLSEPLLGITAS